MATSLDEVFDAAREVAHDVVNDIKAVPSRLQAAARVRARVSAGAAKTHLAVVPQQLRAAALELAEEVRHDFFNSHKIIAGKVQRLLLANIEEAEATRRATQLKRDKLLELIALREELAELKRNRPPSMYDYE